MRRDETTPNDDAATRGGTPVSRRGALRAGVAGLAGVLLARCRSGGGNGVAEPQPSEPGRLAARPAARPAAPPPTPAPGLTPLGLASGRDGLLYVPAGYRADRPAPLVLTLHGAGGTARGGINPFLPLADAAGLLLLAPDSRASTWDFIRGPYGPDVAFIDRALRETFRRCAVDAARIAAEGFSDGASYALSLGLTNGDLFSHLVAFSPGVMAPAAHRGKPRVFVSHGTRDQILPIDVTSRRIVPELRGAGYEVAYQEFDGPHTVPPEIARAAVDWLTA